MARKWDEFSEPGSPRSVELHVSMQPTGTILLSRRAHEALDSPTHVVLSLEHETDTVGIRPVPPRTTNAFLVYPMGRYGTARLHAKRFCDKHEIRLDQTIRFPTAAVEDGVLLLEFRYHVPSPRRVRKKG